MFLSSLLPCVKVSALCLKSLCHSRFWLSRVAVTTKCCTCDCSLHRSAGDWPLVSAAMNKSAPQLAAAAEHVVQCSAGCRGGAFHHSVTRYHVLFMFRRNMRLVAAEGWSWHNRVMFESRRQLVPGTGRFRQLVTVTFSSTLQQHDATLLHLPTLHCSTRGGPVLLEC